VNTSVTHCSRPRVDPAKCGAMERRPPSTALAFLDGHARQPPAAGQWLQNANIEHASGGVAERQRL